MIHHRHGPASDREREVSVRLAAVLRRMGEQDAEAVLAIYQAGLDTGNASFETAAPDWERFDRSKLPDHRLVAVDQVSSEVLGWVAVSAVSSRSVYAGVVEHSVYVAPQARGRRVCTQLLQD